VLLDDHHYVIRSWHAGCRSDLVAPVGSPPAVDGPDLVGVGRVRADVRIGVRGRVRPHYADPGPGGAAPLAPDGEGYLVVAGVRPGEGDGCSRARGRHQPWGRGRAPGRGPGAPAGRGARAVA